MATSTLAGGCVEDPELRNAPSEDVLDARVMRKETGPMRCRPELASSFDGCGTDFHDWTCEDLGFPDAVGVYPRCDLDYAGYDFRSACPWDLTPCRAEPCGNGVIQPMLGEQCDDRGATRNGCQYGYGSSCTRCDEFCQRVENQNPRFCGDGIVDPEEDCEPHPATHCDIEGSNQEACETDPPNVVYCADGTNIESTCNDDCRWQSRACPLPDEAGGCSSTPASSPVPWFWLAAVGVALGRRRR